MLYTFSNAHYDSETLHTFLAHLTDNDAVVLWQDGVLQAVKNREFFANLPNCYLLEQDVAARGLSEMLGNAQIISLTQLIRLTEDYFPQVAI